MTDAASPHELAHDLERRQDAILAELSALERRLAETLTAASAAAGMGSSAAGRSAAGRRPRPGDAGSEAA